MTDEQRSPDRVTIDADGLRLVGDRWAADPEQGPVLGAVLLLHGGGQQRHSWHRTGARLAAAGWTAWAMDARGHGESDWHPGGDYALTALVGDLRRIVARIGEPPVLVGASMGGMTSLIAEGEVGGLARGLVLVDIVARLEPEGLARIEAFMRQAPDGFATLDEVADAIAAYNPHRPRPRSADGLRRIVRQRDDGRWYWHWDPRLLQGGDEPRRGVDTARALAAVARIRVPTLIVQGAESDIVSDSAVEEMLALLPAGRAARVESAGHMVAGDDNDVFTVELMSFLASLPARSAAG